MQKNQIYTQIITDIGYNGEGIAKIDNVTCFIPFALLGEKVEFKVLKVDKNIAYCKCLEVISPADNRVRAKCSVFTKCGGCQLQHLKYVDQLKVKRNIVANCLKKIANIDFDVAKTCKSDYEYYYRNKLQLPIREINGEVKIGFFAENSHRVIDIDNCPIEEEWTTSIIKIVREFIYKNSISVYSDETKLGLVKHLVCRRVADSFLIVIVINGKELPNHKKLIQALSEIGNKFSLFICENTLNNNVVLTDKIKLLYGENFYTATELGISYPISANSFMQVNDNVRNKLYKEVIKLANLTENTVVIDAYSGAGLLTAMMAKHAKKAIGIEIIAEATKNANDLAKLNNLEDKMVNINGACEEILPNLIEQIRKENDEVVVCLDPPRKGCNEKVLQAILESKPNKVIYVSCSPQTLSRDLGILTNTLKIEQNKIVKNDNPNSIYTIKEVKPFDLFPQTKHVETVVLLTK